MNEKEILVPVQPYLSLDADDYKEIIPRRMGISNFYEFHVQEGTPANFKAVPDDSTDLVFGIGEHDVKVLLGGTVLKAKDWEFEDGRYYFGARFFPGKYILPSGLTIQEVVNQDLEIDKNEYGAGLTDALAEAGNVKKRAEILLKYLSENQKDQAKDSVHVLEEYLRQRIYATNGNISIQMLSRETGYSESYIRRIFKQIHGAAGQVDSEELALNCGYYDQSHMLKDFRAFAGTTPEKYKKLLKEKTAEKEKMIREE